VLRAGAFIPPHEGFYKGRLTLHVPLIVPSCRIIDLRLGGSSQPITGPWLRVHNITHSLREGEVYIFDDLYEHAAGNPCPSDRLILWIQFA